STRKPRWPLWMFWGTLLLALLVLAAIKLVPDRKAEIADRASFVTNVAGAVPLGEVVYSETRRLRTAPHGTAVYDRVNFGCGGAIRTAGLKAARDGNAYPGAVLSVPAN